MKRCDYSPLRYDKEDFFNYSCDVQNFLMTLTTKECHMMIESFLASEKPAEAFESIVRSHKKFDRYILKRKLHENPDAYTVCL
jgi:hypothetical protein